MTQFGIGGVTSGVSPTPPGTTGSGSPLGSTVDNNTLLNYGIPDTSQGATFELEEQAAAAARGQSFAKLWAGFKLPAGVAGDFWQLYSMAETFAANTGWKNLPTPQQLVFLAQRGYATMDSLTVFGALAAITKVDQAKMPWAATGLSATQYNQSVANMNDSVYQLTGKSSFADAGLGAIENKALTENWSSTQLQDYIQQNPALNKQFGYLQYGYNFNTYNQYKVNNQAALKQRYGNSFTDTQALQSIASPESTFHASGGAQGQFQPYVQSQEQIPTGRQSSVR